MPELTHPSLQDRCIICCGMLHPEITDLMDSHFLNPRRV